MSIIKQESSSLEKTINLRSFSDVKDAVTKLLGQGEYERAFGILRTYESFISASINSSLKDDAYRRHTIYEDEICREFKKLMADEYSTLVNFLSPIKEVANQNVSRFPWNDDGIALLHQRDEWITEGVTFYLDVLDEYRNRIMSLDTERLFGSKLERISKSEVIKEGVEIVERMNKLANEKFLPSEVIRLKDKIRESELFFEGARAYLESKRLKRRAKYLRKEYSIFKRIHHELGRAHYPGLDESAGLEGDAYKLKKQIPFRQRLNYARNL